MVHHGAGLRRLTERPAWVEQLVADWRRAELSPADRAMLTYVEKLTLRPWALIEADVVTLREAGFSDAAILDINQVTGYYAFVNRLADGLGVELEDFWHEQNETDRELRAWALRLGTLLQEAAGSTGPANSE